MSFVRALSETLRARGLLLAVLVGSALYFIPYVGSYAALILAAGYHVTYQRRVRLGLPGLPVLADARDSVRRGLTVSFIVFSLLIPVVVIPLVLSFVIRTAQEVRLAVLVAGTIAVMLPCELLVIRYAVYDSWSTGFEFVRAFRAMRGHWRPWGRVVLWVITSAAVTAGLRQVAGIGFGSKLTSANLVLAALAARTGGVWLTLGLSYLSMALAFANGLVVTHLLGQLATGVYPLGVETVAVPARTPRQIDSGAEDDFAAWSVQDDV